MNFKKNLPLLWCPLSKTPDSVVCLICLIAGSSSTLLLRDLPAGSFLLIALLICLLSLCWFRSAALALFFVIGFSNAVWQFSQHKSDLLPHQYERVDLAVTGMVDSLPSNRQGDIKFRLTVEQFQLAELAHLSGSQLQLSCYRCPFAIQAGEKWQLIVRLKRPHGFASAGAFDYQKYLFRHKIIARGSVRSKLANKLIQSRSLSANKLRHALRLQLDQIKADHSADLKVGYSLIKALAIGDKSGITNEQSKVLQKTGISHLIAISGLHIGLVFACVFVICNLFLRPFTRLYQKVARQQIALIPALLAAVFYASLAGFAISTQRALLMLLIFCLSRFLARPMSLLQVLILTAVILVLVDPFSVLDQGFWLSFGAVLVIGLSARNKSTKDVNSPTKSKKSGLLSLQPRLWLGMMPLLALLFGQVSLVSPLVNFVLVPIFCGLLIPITLLGMLFINSFFSAPAIYLLEQLAWIYTWIFAQLEKIANFNFSIMYTTELSTWQLGGFFIAGLSYVYCWKIRHVLLLSSLLSLFLFKPVLTNDELQVSLLDVGQGLAMVIRVGDYTMLYDTGPRYRSGFTTAEAVVLPYLRQQGISGIDDLIISHADNDHIGGYSTVVDELIVDRVFSSRQDKLPESLACRADMQWHIGSTIFAFLSPTDQTPKGSNNRSCVLMIEHAGRKVLITGDIEKQVERYMLQAEMTIRADLLLVPHQGSKTSSTQAFIDAVSPSLALVAAGYNNHYGHPHASVINRYQAAGVDVLSTIEHGTIDVIINHEGISWTSQRTENRRFWY